MVKFCEFWFKNTNVERSFFFVSLKLSTRVGHKKLYFAIFEFYDFAKKIWKKNPFKFENSEKIYKGFPRKKKIP